MSREEKIKSMGFDPHTVWYHGTNASFDSFKIDDTPKNGDEHGAGIYFTKYPDVANTYAASNKEGANVIPVHLKLKKELKKPLTRVQIHKIISDSPHLEDSLYNFGDLKYYGKHKVLNDAINSYTHLEDPKHQLRALHNDFYGGSNTNIFLKNVSKHTGADHHYFNLSGDEKGGVVVYQPHQIRSIHASYNKSKAKSSNIMESFKMHLLKIYEK